MSSAVAQQLRAGARVTVACERMVHGGLCLAHLDDGTTVFVGGAIPGETVVVSLHHRKGRAWFADTIDVVEASPHRQVAPCPYVPECGGCQLQHVRYEHQLALKRDIVCDALRRQGVHLDAEPQVVGMADPWRYRRRGEFHVVPGDDGIRDAGLGFNRARSWRPIAVADCLIHEDAITASLPVLREMVREGGGDDLGTLHLTADDAGDELLLRARPSRALSQASIEHAAENLPRRLTTDATTLTWRGHAYRVTRETFVQVNRVQMDAMYARILDGLRAGAGQHVVDAYAGAGILPVHLASQGVRVTCIESNRESARMGVLNARLNDVSALVRYVAEPVESALPHAAAGADALILDPPRAGCGGAVTAWIALAGPATVVYASCDPATLARDLHVLAVSGPYRVRDVTVVDMFPQTHHVETVCALEHAG